MPHLNVNGTRVHFREDGGGAPVIFTHGGGSSGAQWREVCGFLKARFRTITVDHYGHGGTDPWAGPPEARTHEADAELVRAVMAHTGEPCHLVGHSFGGGVVLRLVLEDTAGVRSLTLLEPIALSLLAQAGEQALVDEYMAFAQAYLRQVDAGEVEAAWRQFMEVNSGRGAWERLPEEARERMIAITPGVYSGWHANFNHNTTPAEITEITLPTLLLHGGQTHPRFIRLVEIMDDNLPHTRVEMIPGAGHMSPLTHPEAVAEALARHLDAH